MNIYKVAIIGAGSIGANKPDNIDSPITESILTHAHAVYQHRATELTAIVDKDKDQLNKAVKKWQPKYALYTMEDLENCPEKMDVIIVSTPTDFHYAICGVILLGWENSKRPKLIICEKPFCNNSNEAKTIAELSKEEDIPILTDYPRRFAPRNYDLKNKIAEGEFGECLNCRVLYTRGMKRDGCHWIDLLSWFFGKHQCTEISPAYSIHDLSEEDPTFSGYMSFEKCNNVVFQACDGRKYKIFEVDMCFEKARIRLIDNGYYVEMYPIIEKGQSQWSVHPFLNYSLTDVVRQETGLNYAMYNLINNAVNYLDGAEGLLCTPDDAITVHEILEG